MATIITRASKGSPLTNAELDANFNNINAQLSTAVITGGTIDGATIGATTATTGKFSQLDVDNLRLDGNTISSTDTNGNITLTPNGTGSVAISKLSVTGIATLAAGAILDTPASGVVTNLTGTASININGTVGATTASSGAFTTLSATGVTTVQAGTAALPAITTTGDTNTGIFFPAADTIAFTEGGVESMRIDSSGNVGIGTTSPASLLDVSGAPAGALSRFLNTTAPTLSNDTHAGEAVFLRSGGTAGSGNVQAVLAFGKADGSSLRSGSAIASIQTTADTDQIGLGFYISTGTGSSQTMSQAAIIDSSGNVGIGTSSPTSGLQTAGSSSKSAFKTPNIAEVNTISATAATGTINYDVTTQSVLYYTTNASGNFTVNFRGSSGTTLNTVMSTGESLSATFLVTNGATAYYNSAVQVDGSSVTPKWQGGTAPTSGNASSIDSYTYVIIKTGSAAFTVLASQTKFA